jgi:hypothetical protein
MVGHANHYSTQLPAPYSRVFLEKLIVAQLVKKFSAVCGIRKMITKWSQKSATDLCPDEDMWVPHDHDMELVFADVFHLQRIPGDVLNKQSRTTDKGWSFILDVGWGG